MRLGAPRFVSRCDPPAGLGLADRVGHEGEPDDVVIGARGHHRAGVLLAERSQHDGPHPHRRCWWHPSHVSNRVPRTRTAPAGCRRSDTVAGRDPRLRPAVLRLDNSRSYAHNAPGLMRPSTAQSGGLTTSIECCLVASPAPDLRFVRSGSWHSARARANAYLRLCEALEARRVQTFDKGPLARQHVVVTNGHRDSSGAVSEPFRWVSPREIIEGDEGPDPNGGREPAPRSPRTPSASAYTLFDVSSGTVAPCGSRPALVTGRGDHSLHRSVVRSRSLQRAMASGDSVASAIRVSSSHLATIAR